MTTRRALWLAIMGVGLGRLVAAQAAQPLRKAELVRLLANALISPTEVAAVVRRNCLAFRPTERDWADIRDLGATQDVVASIEGCAVGRATARGATTTGSAAESGVHVVVRHSRIVAAAGAPVGIPVLAARGGRPHAGVRLLLKGSAGLGGTAAGDVVTATDDSGFAVFRLGAGRHLATYRFEVALASGAPLPGRPTVDLVVRPGPPATAWVEPRQVVFDHGLDTVVSVVVTLRDSLGHAPAGEPVVLMASDTAPGFVPDTGVTDSVGRATLTIPRSAVRRTGTIQASVRGAAMAWVDVLVGAPLAESVTGFRSPPTLRGKVRTSLDEALVFEAWTRLGLPAVGRQVSFHAVNAAVSPTTATTDTAGRAFVGVTLGERVGQAIVVATIDSVEKHVTLQVEPGLPVELVLRRDGVAVDSGPITVALGETLRIRLRGRDAYGNWANVATLARPLREQRDDISRKLRLLRLDAVADEGPSVLLTFVAVRTGSAELAVGYGIAASVRVEVVRDSRSLPAGVSTPP